MIALLRLTVVGVVAVSLAAAEAQQVRIDSLNACGRNAEPYFEGDIRDRPCNPAFERIYRPRYSGLGYEILDIESGACFVPDAAYQQLDAIIDRVKAEVDRLKLDTRKPTRQLVLKISELTSKALRDLGYGLQVPTLTLADTLLKQPGAAADQLPFMFDCDTGSMILLTIAEQYGLPAALVETTLSSGSQHNIVAWTLASAPLIYWDMNEQRECRLSPPETRAWEDRPMSRDEVFAYVLRIRAITWRRIGQQVRALPDLEKAMQLAPNEPDVLNAFAWLIASANLPGRERYMEPALQAAKTAVEINPVPFTHDTLACVYALMADYDMAVKTQRIAVSLAEDDDKADYQDRIDDRFRHYAPMNCTGQ